MLVKMYRVSVTKDNSGNLMYTMVTMANNTVLYLLRFTEIF
jgi:hypothetical protein